MAKLLVAANRAPVTFAFAEDGSKVPARGGGGMITIAGAVGDRGASWVSAAMSDADREVAAEGPVDVNGLEVRFLPVAPEVYAEAYDVVANATLWFAYHGLFDRPRAPIVDRHWWKAWEGFRAYNAQFAEAIAEQATEGAVVLIQDYHLALLAGMLAPKRPDLRMVHFSHTPFATPDALRVLPDSVVDELLTGMAGNVACGFHSPRWAECFTSAFTERGLGAPPAVFVAPLVPAADDMAELAASEAGQDGHRWLDEQLAGRRMILRVDRIELSKNLLRGFHAFDELLAVRPDLRGQVVFAAMVYGSRENLDSYLSYRREVEELVDEINARWGRADWTPIVYDAGDTPERSAAALTRYDVLLVNPLRDGLNLVAMEGPVLNETDGVLALSREAGAWDVLGDAALGIDPFDVSGTAAALASALDMEPAERAGRAARLREAALRRTPADWLDSLLAAAGESGA